MSGTEQKLPVLTALLPDWYSRNRRELPWRQHPTPYQVWLSEIMLQQTRVEAVRGYFSRFTQALPDIAALADCEEDHLLKLWEGLGYYSRVRNLQKTAQILLREYAGALPADYATLLKFPGIGPYTAGAIASIAFGIPVPAVDGNVLRVFSRFCADEHDIADPRQQAHVRAALAQVIPADNPGDFNQALMELGATICLPGGAPACADCPLSADCEGLRQACAALLPNKTPSRARRIEERTVLLLVQNNRIALRKRPARGLLAGLWELPSLPDTPDATEIVRAVRSFGLEPLRIEPMRKTKHIFTHVEWHLSGYSVTIGADEMGEGLVWATPLALAETYALPSAFAPLLAQWLDTGPHFSG